MASVQKQNGKSEPARAANGRQRKARKDAPEVPRADRVRRPAERAVRPERIVADEVYDELDLLPMPPERPARRKMSGAAPAGIQQRRSAPRKAEMRGAHSDPRRERPTPRAGEVYDELDLPPAARRRAPKARAHAPRGGRLFGAVNMFLIAAILLLSGIGIWRTLEYRALAEMKAMVSRQTFYPGTTVEGIDVSGMTLEQALEYWDKRIEPNYREARVTLDDGSSVTAYQLGYASDYENVLKRAWSMGRRGSLEQRYLLASAGSARDYAVTRKSFDEALVRRFVEWAAGQVDAAPQNARVTAFDPESQEFEFASERVGYRLDQDALAADVEAAAENGGGSVARSIETLQPSVTLEDISGSYGLITSATTNASSSSSNRISNIRLAMSIINGTCLHPGDQFSFNEVVGKRTKERGFKVATAYSSGTVTEEVGGGICQVSTTLFNAAVKADLKIDERHPHSLTVSYVDLGKDAAVDWGNKDLKFTNTTDGDIYILCNVSDDKRLRIYIYGQVLPNGETITVEGVKTGEIDYDTQYQLSFDLYSGQTRKLQKGKKGYTAEAYKIRWDADGNQLSRELLCKSRYSATPEIIEYGQ